MKLRPMNVTEYYKKYEEQQMEIASATHNDSQVSVLHYDLDHVIFIL